jgi:hypothetical protein
MNNANSRNYGVRRIQNIFRKMFPGTDYKVISKQEGGLYTASGLPLKGLLLPNVESVKVLGRERDKYSEIFGIERAYDRMFLMHRLEPHKGNQFLTKALNRLNTYAKNGERNKFDTLAKILERHSITYRIVCLWRVENRWYKELTANQVRKCWWKVNRLALRNATDYRYVYVEKEERREDGSIKRRPLSVPPIHWRVWANMKYTLVWIWLRNHGYPEWNHGGIAERGVNSCWKHLWLNILSKKYKNIYEYDLSKFFDRIRLGVIEEALSLAKMPPRMSRWCVASLKDKVGKVPSDVQAELMYARLGLETQREGGWTEFTPRQIAKFNRTTVNTGVPQGYSLSPILACLGKAYAFTRPAKLLDLYARLNELSKERYINVMEEFKHLLPKVWEKRIIAYMDDGILFGNKWLNEKTIDRFRKAMEFIGSPVNEAKSRWLKRDGEWVVASFKFLGVTYHTGTERLEATSRNGKPMLLPAADLEKGNVDLRGPSGKVFLQYLKGHGEYATAMKWNIFDSVLARCWASGEKPELREKQFELLAHPQSFVGYYREWWYKTGPKTSTTVRTPFTVANASSRASRMLFAAHDEIARRSRARRKSRPSS